MIGSAAAAIVVLLATEANARINATSAFQVFGITECEVCTTDPDSIFCTDGKGYIYNASLPKQYVKKDAKGNPIPGESSNVSLTV